MNDNTSPSYFMSLAQAFFDAKVKAAEAKVALAAAESATFVDAKIALAYANIEVTKAKVAIVSAMAEAANGLTIDESADALTIANARAEVKAMAETFQALESLMNV